MDKQDLKELRSLDDHKAYQREVKAEIAALNTTYSGQPFPDDVREEFAYWKETNDKLDSRIVELDAREKYVRSIAENPQNVEREDDSVFESAEARGTAKERDIYDMRAIRIDPSNPQKAGMEYRDRAMRALEVSTFPLVQSASDRRAYGADPDRIREHVEYLLKERDTEDGQIAQRILVTGGPTYRRAFAKHVAGRTLTGEERRALEERAPFAETTTGIPIPYQLDPTIIPTSNLSVNPWRAICSVEQITGNEWRGATSGAITAAYAAEGTEALDNTPTLTQPSVLAVRAQAFVPYSIEVGQDWGGLQTEMARLIQDAKDDLESNKFFSGSGTNEPTGINAATSGADVATAGVAAFVIGDLYTLEAALAPRFRPRASIVGNRVQFGRVRQFDTAGGAGLWLRVGELLPNNVATPGNLGVRLMGYPAYESSQMLTVLTTGTRILVLGDFSYYKIVDRIGLSVEVIPQLMGLTRGYPTGQRGLYAFWRNGGKLIAEAAFKFLKTA